MGRNKEITVGSVFENYSLLSLEDQIKLLAAINQDLENKKAQAAETDRMLSAALNGKHN